MERYRVNEIFYSLQGEGVRAGTPNLFLRFSRCNLECRVCGDSSPDRGSS
jgi:organic radical activating enzyme